MTEKTARALYALLKELYQSRTAKDFVDVYGREEREQRHEAQKREEPKVGEVYRDIFGNKYIVTAVHDSFPDDARGNKPFIVLKHVESNGRIALSDYFSPYLEDFMNPTFKKYN